MGDNPAGCAVSVLIARGREDRLLTAPFVAEGRSRADIHETGAHRQRIIRRSFQRHRQSNDAGGRHQDHRFGRG